MTRKIEKTIDQDSGEITIGFASGNTISVNVKDFPKAMQKQAMFHGFSQKFSDAGAGKSGEELEKRVSDVIEALKAGDWTVRGTSTGGGSTRVTQLVEAVARVKGYSLDEAKEKVSALTDEQRDNLKKSPTIQSAILDIKREKAEAKAQEATGEDNAVLDSI